MKPKPYYAHNSKTGRVRLATAPRSPDAGRDVEVNLNFDTTKMTEDQVAALWEAARLLDQAGISFDTGGGGGSIDWEWDWSLSGPVSVSFRRFTDTNPTNRYVMEIAYDCFQQSLTPEEVEQMYAGHPDLSAILDEMDRLYQDEEADADGMSNEDALDLVEDLVNTLQ